MKYSSCLLAFVLSCFTTAWACSPGEAQKSAVKATFQDDDARLYICGDQVASCSVDEFASKLKITPIALKRKTQATNAIKDGLLIEPLSPAKQTFSAVFLLESCNYQLVFSPDVTQNDMVFLKKFSNDMPWIRSTVRESADRLSQTDYAYSIAKKTYLVKNTKCFNFSDAGHLTPTRCNQ